MKICSSPGCTRALRARGLCSTCYSRLTYRPSEKRNAQKRAYYAANRSRLSALAARQGRERKSGFCQGLVEQLHAAQKGRCAICQILLNRTHKKGAAGEHADHCHLTGVPRGLLCATCNKSLGAYEKHQRPAGLRIEPYEVYLANPPAKAFL